MTAWRSDRPAKLAWLIANRHLWHPNLRKHLVEQFLKAQLYSPSTTTAIVRQALPKLLEDARDVLSGTARLESFAPGAPRAPRKGRGRNGLRGAKGGEGPGGGGGATPPTETR